LVTFVAELEDTMFGYESKHRSFSFFSRRRRKRMRARRRRPLTP